MKPNNSTNDKIKNNEDFIEFLRAYKEKDTKYKQLLKNKPNMDINNGSNLKKWYTEFLSIFK